MIKFLDLKKQYETIKSEIDLAIHNVINDTAFVNGKYAQIFEGEFAKYQNTKYCVGVGNGTDALEIAIESLNLPKGSEVIVPANTFIASSEAVTRSAHKVVFCDCNPKNYTISIEDFKNKITSNTKAVIAVHLYGHPCDMDAIFEITREKNIKVIEDSAQAHGAKYKGKRIGAIGDIGTFSFYPGKNLGAYGDAGAIVTNDKELSIKCRMIANHGRTSKFGHEFEGRNSRMDGIQAAILSVKLKHLDAWILKRNKIAEFYNDNLNNLPAIILPENESWAKHAYHLYVIRTKKRDELKKFLSQKNIQTGIHYPIALPKLDAYKYLGEYDRNMFANQVDTELLSLPIGEHLSESDIQIICDSINKFYS